MHIAPVTRGHIVTLFAGHSKVEKLLRISGAIAMKNYAPWPTERRERKATV